MSTESRHLVPPFKWAQDKEKVYVTVEVPSAKDVKCDFATDSIKFSATSGLDSYSFEAPLADSTDPVGCTYGVTARAVEVVIKKEKKGTWWQQLLKDKNAFKTKCSIDWSRWKDEDDEEEEGFRNFGMPGGFGGMPGGFGGMPGGFDMSSLGGDAGDMDMGDDDVKDSDDEELPDLEVDKKSSDKELDMKEQDLKNAEVTGTTETRPDNEEFDVDTTASASVSSSNDNTTPAPTAS